MSRFRQVPDNQECWVEENGSMLVVEILEYERQVKDEDAALYFYRDLAETNGADAQEAGLMFQNIPDQIAIPGLPTDSSICRGKGCHTALIGEHQRESQETRTIQVELCAIRLPTHTADLLVTLSVPTQLTVNTQDAAINSSFFLDTVKSIRVRDWGLFSAN